MIYAIEVYVYSFLFLIVYMVFLKGTTAYAWSRAYLLASACLPFVLPFVHLPGMSAPVADSAAAVMLPVVNVFSDIRDADVTYSYGALMVVLYLVVTAGMTVVFCRQYFTAHSFLHGRVFRELPGRVRLITGCGYGPGSLGRYVFFPGNDVEAHILEHELAHIRHRHSADVLFMRVIRCFLWPDVLLFVIERELRAIHEFQADSAAAGDAEDYAHTLLNSLFHTNRFSLSHTFFNHPIKRRIIMLQKKTKSRSALSAIVARTVIAALLPVSCIVYLQSCSRPQDAVTSTPVAEQVADVKPEQKQPEAGCDLTAFMLENTVYPEGAKSRKVEGKVIVGFTVNEEGKLTAPEVVRSPDDELSAEALRVVKLLPDWKPATVDGKAVAAKMYLPVSFEMK